MDKDAAEAYLQRLAPSKGVLAQMQARGEGAGFPIIGPLVGSLCAQWAQAVGARRVFEMGSGFGYSTAFFAKAVGPEGVVVHTEDSDELQAEAKEWLGRLRLRSRVEFEPGNAIETLRRRKGAWDVVFIDIEKEDYPQAWEVARHRVRTGGVIVTDNTLWQGKVWDPKAKDAQTRGVREYTRLAFEDEGFATTIVPLRDGVAVSLRL
ncbi:MAG: hypothetical protein QOD77_967 [Thermoplasmata archaeon]|jgi:predicted O-methyltransferase YrrM|nr:hypothetical protein [Thermoplasmata archaeon]